MSTTDLDTRISHLEGEVRGMQHVAEALFKLSDPLRGHHSCLKLTAARFYESADQK